MNKNAFRIARVSTLLLVVACVSFAQDHRLFQQTRARS
jgi:hypothetical protein